MSSLYLEFAASVQQSSRNATLIFLISLAGVLAYLSFDTIGEKWRPFVKLAAWVYNIIVIAIVVAFSMED